MKRTGIGGWMALAACLLAVGIASAQNSKPRAAKKVAAPVPMAVPFEAGEQLAYRISWGPADAATAQLSILPPAVVRGVSAWRFQAKASTIKATRFLYALDDRFESSSDTYTLSSVQFEMSIREPNKNQDRVIRFSHDGEPPQDDGETVRVPAGTQDPVGLLYALRAVDWGKTKKAVFPLYEGKKLYEVRAEFGSAGAVNVPAGAFQATPIDLQTFERNQELASTRFRVWLANDAARTPVLMEAELPFGKLRIELVDSRRN